MKKETALHVLIIICFFSAFTMGFTSYPLVTMKVAGLAFIQTVVFSMVSRSRNRDNAVYHVIASMFSHTLWFFTMRELVLQDFDTVLIIFYTLFATTGSLSGVKISMWIEQKLLASADGHLKK